MKPREPASQEAAAAQAAAENAVPDGPEVAAEWRARVHAARRRAALAVGAALLLKWVLTDCACACL